MKAKTIFLNDKDEVIIYEDYLHDDVHCRYMREYYSNLKITDYIPILLSHNDNCVIDLSRSYSIGCIYLPVWMSEFQKKYFTEERSNLEKFKLYLNGYSIEDPIKYDELLSRIDMMPTRPKEKKL